MSALNVQIFHSFLQQYLTHWSEFVFYECCSFSPVLIFKISFVELPVKDWIWTPLNFDLCGLNSTGCAQYSTIFSCWIVTPQHRTILKYMYSFISLQGSSFSYQVSIPLFLASVCMFFSLFKSIGISTTHAQTKQVTILRSIVTLNHGTTLNCNPG